MLFVVRLWGMLARCYNIPYWSDEGVVLGKRFFVYQRDDTEKNKKYWENAFAYYYGWYPGFKVRMLNSIIFSRRNNMIITKMRNLLLFFWTTHDRIPNYFFFQILYNELINNNSHYNVVPVESDCLPHYLQQLIMILILRLRLLMKL